MGAQLYTNAWRRPLSQLWYNIQDSSLVSYYYPSSHSLSKLTVFTMNTTTITLLLAFFVFQASASRSPNAGQLPEKRYILVEPPATSPVSTNGIRYIGCNDGRQATIEKAVTAANDIIANTNRNIAGLATGTQNFYYKTFFGKYDSSLFTAVKLHFGNMVNKTTSFPFDCQSCSTPTKKEVGLWKKQKKRLSVYEDKPSPKINLCQGFWKAPLRGTDSQAGTIIRELSRVPEIGGTQDYGYTQSQAKGIAKKDIVGAAMSADNHMYFAVNLRILRPWIWG
ncbi:hypothetical protein ACGC1H_004014 [Rhizoctonia solani]